MTWPGCHGVLVRGDTGGWGQVEGVPLAEAAVGRGAVPGPDTPALWAQRAVVDGVEVVRSMHRRDDGTYVLDGSRGPRVGIDTTARTVLVDGDASFVQQQLVAALALPLLLHDAGVLVLHGAALVRDNRAVLVCGPSGAGKSNAMIALTDAGWSPLSEDVCAVPVAGETATVWPGPPWVRVHHGEAGPLGAPMIERGHDKTAWSIKDRLPTTPAVVGQIVLLEPPGGDAPRVTDVGAGEAIGALAAHGVWLRDPSERGQALFGLLSALVARVAVKRLRLPRSEQWRDVLRAQFD